MTVLELTWLQVFFGAISALVAVAGLVVMLRRGPERGEVMPAPPVVLDLDDRLGGAEVRRQLECTIRGMFSGGATARRFERIQSRCAGADPQALRQLMHAIGMEAYRGRDSGAEYWRFRR